MDNRQQPNQSFADLGEYNGRRIRAVNYDLKNKKTIIETVDGSVIELPMEYSGDGSK
jgi:hypothetical protein